MPWRCVCVAGRRDEARGRGSGHASGTRNTNRHGGATAHAGARPSTHTNQASGPSTHGSVCLVCANMRSDVCASGAP
eukprot:2235610-Prymnesium_polylepis.1